MKRINEAEAAEILKSKDNILILTHRSPDGDTLGCAFALRRVLSGMGKTVPEQYFFPDAHSDAFSVKITT